MSKTITEIKEEKNQIEKKILSLLIDFEKSSEMRIEHVRVSIDHHTYEEEQKSLTQRKKPIRKLKGVLDVAINVNIDNDPRSLDTVY